MIEGTFIHLTDKDLPGRFKGTLCKDINLTMFQNPLTDFEKPSLVCYSDNTGKSILLKNRFGISFSNAI